MSIVYDSVLHKFREQQPADRIPGGMTNKGSVPTASALNNLVNVQDGDWYRVEDTGLEYYFDGTVWRQVGPAPVSGGITSAEASAIASNVADSMVHDGTLTIYQGYWEEVTSDGSTFWSSGTSQIDFSANASDNATVTVPGFQSATVYVSQGGSALGSFTSLDPEDTTIVIQDTGASVTYGQDTVSSLVAGSNIVLSMGTSGALLISGSTDPIKYNGLTVTSLVSGGNISMTYSGGALSIGGLTPAAVPTYSGVSVTSYVPGDNVSMYVSNGGLQVSAGITHSGTVFTELSAGANVVMSSAGSALIISATGGGGGGGTDVIFSGSTVTSITEGNSNVSMSILNGVLSISATGEGGGGGTVGSGILTISQGGVSKGSFNANATTDSSINLDAPVPVIVSGATVTSMAEGSNIHLDMNGGTMIVSASGLVDTSMASAIASSMIGSATLTIYQGGVSKGEFNANATTASSIYLDAGGGGGGGGLTPLTSITQLTGTSVTIAPGGAYAWTVNEDSTLNISGGETGKTGDSLIDIDLGNAAISPGTGLGFADTLASNTIHQCAVRWNGTSATLYTLDNVGAQYMSSYVSSYVSAYDSNTVQPNMSSYVSSYVSAYDSNTVQPISTALEGKMDNPVSSGSSGQFLENNGSAHEWKSLSTLTIIQSGVSSTFNPGGADTTVVITGGGGGGGGGGVTAAQAKKIAMIFG